MRIIMISESSLAARTSLEGRELRPCVTVRTPLSYESGKKHIYRRFEGPKFVDKTRSLGTNARTRPGRLGDSRAPTAPTAVRRPGRNTGPPWHRFAQISMSLTGPNLDSVTRCQVSETVGTRSQWADTCQWGRPGRRWLQA